MWAPDPRQRRATALTVPKSMFPLLCLYFIEDIDLSHLNKDDVLIVALQRSSTRRFESPRARHSRRRGAGEISHFVYLKRLTRKKG